MMVMFVVVLQHGVAEVVVEVTIHSVHVTRCLAVFVAELERVAIPCTHGCKIARTVELDTDVSKTNNLASVRPVVLR